MKNKNYYIFSHSPGDDDHPPMTLGLDLREVLDWLKDGWEEEFKKKYGREFKLEDDLIDKDSGKPIVFSWINEIGIDKEKLFPRKKWKPSDPPPLWVSQSPSYLLLAHKLLKEGRSLSEMHWKKFENLVGELLEKEGWEIELTKGSKDGGVDVVAKKI
jgi:hypothetical protein